MKTPTIITRTMNKTTAVWVLASAGLVILAKTGVIPTTFVEVAGFLSGALCVWLLVKQNIWNWPIGIINAVMYIVLFYQAKLFADMALQVIYVILGVLGWYWWLRGGNEGTELRVQRTSKKHASILVASSIPF